MAKLGRNDPCHCGSGKKYKKCCLQKDEEEARLQAVAAVQSAYRPSAPTSAAPLGEEPALDLSGFGDILDRFAGSPRRERRKTVTLPTDPLDDPPTAGDFAPDVDPDHLYDAIERLTLDWVGTVHKRHGLPLDRLGMARDVLEDYLFERADEDAAGQALLIPLPSAFDETLWKAVRSAPGSAAALLALLPTYVDYLVERALIDEETAAGILPNLWTVRHVILKRLREELDDPAAVEVADRVDWPEPIRKPPAPTPPGLIPLLSDLRQAGQHPDSALLERIMAYGPAAVPPLIELATDDWLLFAESDEAETWTPNHAVRLLGELRAVEAIEPLVGLLMIPGDYYIANDVQEAFGRIGPAALPHLRRVFTDRTQDQYLRARAAEAMVEIAGNYPETREALIRVEQSELDECTNPELNGFIIGDLIELGAVEAMPSIERAFAEDRVDPTIVGDLEAVQDDISLHSRPAPIQRLEPDGVEET